MVKILQMKVFPPMYNSRVLSTKSREQKSLPARIAQPQAGNVSIDINDVAAKLRDAEIKNCMSIWDMFDLDLFFDDKEAVFKWFAKRYPDIDDWDTIREVYKTSWLDGLKERIEEYLLEQGQLRAEAGFGAMIPFIRYIIGLGENPTKALILVARQAELGFDYTEDELWDKLENDIDELMEPWKAKKKEAEKKAKAEDKKIQSAIDRSDLLMDEWESGKMSDARILEVLRDTRDCAYMSGAKPNCFFCTAFCWKYDFVKALSDDGKYTKFVGYDYDDDEGSFWEQDEW